MKYIGTCLLCTAALLFAACGDESSESSDAKVENPVGTYLDSRTDAMGLAEKSLEESKKRAKEQEDIMDKM
ncbi:MAG: hypothetical protein U9R27_04390 [Campylobacterota bacterium]|nr:hypothetical protein [Campylobacterota bacterium]